MAMLDGRVVRLQEKLASEKLRATFTIRGGERLLEQEDGWEWLEDRRDRARRAEPTDSVRLGGPNVGQEHVPSEK